MTTYKKGQNLVLTFKDRMEDPKSWEAYVQVDLEEVTPNQIEGYFANSCLIDIKVVSEDYADTPLSQTKKI